MKPIFIQFLRHTAIIAVASGNPVLQAEFDMIIITYFFLIHLVEYTGSKSEITPFCLEDVYFICGHSIFAHLLPWLATTVS